MSNHYPPWWTHTLTIYNKIVNPENQQVTWVRHVLENCFWKYNHDRRYIGNVVYETKEVICRIPKTTTVPYLIKHEWLNSDTSETYTLSNGDIIVHGEVEDVIDDYTKGQRHTDLIAKYKELQGCIEIESFIDDTGLGMGCEHYHVKGA